VLRGSMHEALAMCDVAVGSYSTAVLEALLVLKTPIFFNTGKWGDYYELRSLPEGKRFFAESPGQFMELVREGGAPPEALQALRERFFGDPYQNGNIWLADRIEYFLSGR
jgi:hypothetical protein